MGKFTVIPWDGGRVYIEDERGGGGTFPRKDIEKILRGEESAKALRRYYDENF